jgi:hypothetical protein
MAKIVLFLAVLCGFAWIVFSAAGGVVADGPNWGTEVCSSARSFCRDPQPLIYYALALACLWLVAKFISAVRH